MLCALIWLFSNELFPSYYIFSSFDIELTNQILQSNIRSALELLFGYFYSLLRSPTFWGRFLNVFIVVVVMSVPTVSHLDHLYICFYVPLLVLLYFHYGFWYFLLGVVHFG
jgi:hypothetical protein